MLDISVLSTSQDHLRAKRERGKGAAGGWGGGGLGLGGAQRERKQKRERKQVKERDRQTDRQRARDRQAGRQTDRESKREREREIDDGNCLPHIISKLTQANHDLITISSVFHLINLRQDWEFSFVLTSFSSFPVRRKSTPNKIMQENA